MVREDRQEKLAHVDIWEGIPVLEDLMLLCCLKAQQESILSLPLTAAHSAYLQQDPVTTLADTAC